jgi:L-2-hydroxyglutarate oxidase LhgO
MDTIETLVVGAGVIGLAIADALARAGREVVVVDSEGSIGSGVSSRNSEVIHSGIYYAPGSGKARLCVHGRRLLYEFCDLAGVPYRRCGKLIVATGAEQLPDLHALMGRGLANGVEELRLVGRDEALRIEPHLDCVAAIASNSTGVIDSHALMTALLGRAQAHGTLLVLRTRFERAVAMPQAGYRVGLRDSQGATDYAVRRLVIAAGLFSPTAAARIECYPRAHIPVERYARGNYFALAGRPPFARLIYPVPQKDGLGVHLTMDLGGQARFGPDVEWIDAPRFDLNPERLPQFYDEIRKYWPRLPDGALRPDYAGVRPKIYESHEPAADFRIDGPSRHGLPGVVCLFGIESPGLTSALAIAVEVAELLADDF